MSEKPTLKISTMLLLLLALQLNNTFAQSLQVSLSSTPSSCTKRDGILTAIATGGTPPYTYSFNGGPYQSSPTWKGYGSHYYYVTVKDAMGQLYSDGDTVKTPDPALNVAIQYAGVTSTCNASDAKLILSASGGTPPYSFSMDMVSFQPGSTFNNLYQGFYTFGVKDANGCISRSTGSINSRNNCFINFGMKIFNAECNNSGLIEILYPNSANSYTYSLDGVNYQSSNSFTGLPVGIYKIYIKDPNGMVVTHTTNIVNNCEFSIDPSTYNAICGNNNGRIEVLAMEGMPPYQFSIDGINFQSNPIFSGLTPGTYTITAKDAKGFECTADVTLTNVCLSASSSATDATCGDNNGTITANASSGVPPYSYSIDGVNFQASAVFSGISQGSYVVTVKDASGTSSTSPVSVGNIPGPQISASSTAASCTDNDGNITISGTGGTAPYLYAIGNSGFQNNSQFNRLSTGNYTAIVKDANGCLASQPVIVALTNNLFIDAGPDLTINEGETAILEPSSNGTSFSWTPATALNNTSIFKPEASPDITTQYYVTAHGGVCEANDSVSVIVKPVPVSDFFVPTAFTPNSDGLNDLFKVKAVGIRQFKYFAVFNRWGQRVFYATNPGTGWNGTINGKISPTGTYVWMAAGISIKGKNVERRGTVELIR